MGLLNNLYNKAKTALTDNEGWFRQGKFTPVTQITGKSLQQQMNPPMLSPLASNAPNRPTTWNTPETYEQEQSTVIAPPKPSFKTQAAEKLNSRLDQIKRFGSSVVAKSMDNEGIVRQGQLKPFAPLDDAIKKPVVNFINKNTIFADPESNNGDNFWSSKRGADLAEKRKLQELKGENAVLESIIDASPIGMLDQTTKTQQAFSPYVNKFIDEQDQREKEIDTMVTNDIGKKLLKIGTRTGTNLLDQFNQSATSFSDSYRDLAYNTDGDRNVVKNIANILKSSAGAYAAGTGKTVIPSFLNANAETDFTKGITAGYTDIVTGTTQRGNNGGDSISGKIGRFIGGIAGWKKNPINKAGSDIMDKFIPYENIIGKNGEIIVEAWKPIKNKILNFITTRGTRGMLEDVIDNLSKLEDDKTDAQNTIGFIRDELLGGLSEIVSEKVMDVGSKALKSLWNGHPGQAITDMFRTKPDIKPEIETPKNSKFRGNQYVTIPVDTKIKEPKFVGNMDGKYESRWVGDKLVRFDKTTGKPVPKVGDGSQMMGGIAGMETYQDENGETKVRFNPEKAMAGIAIMGGVNSNAGKSVIKNMFKNTKVPDIKAPEVKPKTELDWKIENNKKPETTKSIADIFANRKTEIGAPTQITVKGKPIDTDRLIKEGWETTQIDYAIKQANNAKGNIENIDGYVRGILKKQYPNQASKMGKKPIFNEDQEMERRDAFRREPLVDMEDKFKQLEEAGYNPNPEIKVEPPKVEPPKQPKPVTEILKPEAKQSELERLTQAKKAELDYADIKRKEITEMMTKEGFDTSTATAEKIMSGEIKASPELKSAIEKHSKALGGETVKYKGLPEDKLKENYVPHVKKESLTPVDTESDGFVGMMNRNTFDPTKKRNNLIDTEDMANVDEAFRQEHISVLNSKYYDAEQANKIMAEHQLPPEKGDEVLDFVKQEREEADKIVTEHIEKTDFGTKHDYLGDARKHDEKLAEITGQKTERPVVPTTHTGFKNTVDNVVNKIRSDAQFFADKTNKEIADAFTEFQMSQTGETTQRYDVALNKFIKTLTKYDYADPVVKDRINLFIDNSLKQNKILEKTTKKILRGVTEVFSMAQIGGNVKTDISQPLEVFRLIPEHGFKPFFKGITSAFNTKEATRLSTEYLPKDAISGNLAQHPLYKSVMEDPDFKSKAYDSFKKFIFKGLEVGENWKNIAYASTLETVGKEKGLKGKELKSFVTKELMRLAHISSKDMTPEIMKNKAGASALLQYSQYALKNFVLKWDTATAKNTTATEKMKKLTGLILADVAQKGVLIGITGAGIGAAKEWFSNSGLPTSFGPIVTVPYQMGKDAWDYYKLPEEEREKQTSLMDIEMATILRNFIPMGNQISKTKDALKVMDKGYEESKKGNVNYVVGDMNPIQKVQATVFGKGSIPAKKEANKRWNNLKEDGIYPTLTAEQSATLKDLPKDEQKAYYDSKMENQKSAKDIIKDEEKKPNLISSIFGKKETKEKQSISSILTSETATNQEKAKAKSIIKEKLDSGNPESINDDDLKTYFFNEVDKLPESTASEKQVKTIAKFKKLDSIYDSETLDEDTKDRLIKLSGVSKEDITYYNNAKDDATVKAMRQEELAGQISRDEWMSQLEDGRKLVGNKQIVDNSTLDELYERGMLSDAERDYLKAVKYDPAQGKFYVDRDYKDKQGKASATATKKQKDALDKVKKSIYDDTDSSRKMTTKSIVSYLNNKPKQSGSTATTIGTILSGGKLKKKVTQVSKNSSNIKRVKSQYRFSK